MSTGLVGSIILWLIVAIIAIVVVVYLLNWLYHRSTKEVAFVRTGLGGETVVINGGALVLPIVHEVTPVNLNVVRIPVARVREDAVISRDRMRVDIEAEFFVRVVQEPQAVAAAASTLGRRTTDPERLADLLSGKFVGALRSAAAEMTLDEMHERRADFVAIVEERAAGVLARNGLELETVAITDLDQTNLDYFNPANRFDAEGLTQLIETIEARRKLRNDIEQSAMVAIRTRNLEAEKETLKLEEESESSRLNQERSLEAMRAAQHAEIVRTRVAREAEAEQARIASERVLEEARIEREKLIRRQQIQQRHDVETAEISANEDLERARIVSERQVREARILSEEETECRDIARGQQIESARIAANEAVETARITQDRSLDKARIERDKILRALQIGQRQANEEAEIAAREEVERARIASDRGLEEARIIQDRDLKRIGIERSQALELAEIEREIAVLAGQAAAAEARVATEAARAQAVEAEEKVTTTREKQVAERIAAVDRLIAEKNADTARIAAEADKLTAAVAAEAQRLRNEAENILSEDARAAMLRAKLIDRLEGIVRESVRPMEKIEGIKILHVDGLAGGASGPRSPTDEVIESALRYRAQAPLIDEMMKEIGVENPNVARMGDIFRSARDAQSIAKESGESGTGATRRRGKAREKDE